MLQENRKLHLVKSQLDMYKRQIQELQMKAADETKRADKAEFEMKRHQEKMLGLQKEKEVSKGKHLSPPPPPPPPTDVDHITSCCPFVLFCLLRIINMVIEDNKHVS